MTKTYIPKVPDERVDELSKRIRPTVKFDGELRYIQPVNLHTIAYMWEPKAAEAATGLVPLRDITTYHSYSYYGFFKPSIGEVLKQIPDDLLEQVVAFEIIGSPENADDLNDEQEALNAGYHVATTRLYRKE